MLVRVLLNAVPPLGGCFVAGPNVGKRCRYDVGGGEDVEIMGLGMGKVARESESFFRSASRVQGNDRILNLT